MFGIKNLGLKVGVGFGGLAYVLTPHTIMLFDVSHLIYQKRHGVFFANFHAQCLGLSLTPEVHQSTTVTDLGKVLF